MMKIRPEKEHTLTSDSTFILLRDVVDYNRLCRFRWTMLPSCNYNEIVVRVSKEIAEQFLKNEKDISRKDLLIDGGISEIIRKIGLKTVRGIYEEEV